MWAYFNRHSGIEVETLLWDTQKCLTHIDSVLVKLLTLRGTFSSIFSCPSFTGNLKMAARYFTLQEVVDRVVNDEEVSDFDDKSEEDLPDVSSESENNGDSSENETEVIENTEDSGKFVHTVYIGIEHFLLLNSVALFSSVFYGSISFINIQMLAMKNPTAINGSRDHSASARGRTTGSRGSRGQRLHFRGGLRGTHGRAPRHGRANRRNADPELQWSRDAGVHMVPPQFTEAAPGPSRRFVNPEKNSAKFYFDLLFTNNIWEMLVREQTIITILWSEMIQTNINSHGAQ